MFLGSRQASSGGIDGEHVVTESAQRRNDLAGARDRDVAFLTGSTKQNGNFH
jgi:hypothetical protein